MWAFFSRRLRMWVVLAVAVPVLSWILGKIADVLEARRGPSGVTRSLRGASGWMSRKATGPLRSKDASRAAAAPAGTRDAGVPAR